ncbi:MAG: helix-turn-helix domain-containing protein [Allosphingosinicella sp.]
MGERQASSKAGQERAARLREALRRRGVGKLYGLALDLGVDQSTISRWTTGGAMSLDHAAALCDRLNLSLDWLVFGRGGMDPRGRGEIIEAIADLLDSFEPEVVASFLTLSRAIPGGR